MPFIKTKDDIKIYYNLINEDSKKTPIVFIHGFAVNWTCFKDEISYFKKRNHPILYYDTRGHGKSSVPESEEGFKVEKYVEDLKLLIREVGFRKVYLVGHSFGGIQSLKFTIENPGKVRRLVILNSAHKIPDENLLEKGLHKHHYLKLFYDKILKNKEFKKSTYLDFKKNDLIHNKYYLALKCLLNTNLKTAFLLADELMNFKLKNISNISCPTLIIESNGEEFFSKKEELELHKKIKTSIIKFFPGGHDLIVKKSDLVSKEIEQFFMTKDEFFG